MLKPDTLPVVCPPQQIRNISCEIKMWFMLIAVLYAILVLDHTIVIPNCIMMVLYMFPEWKSEAIWAVSGVLPADIVIDFA